VSAALGDPSDSAARLEAVDSSGSVLVQAPAGSGKTTLLAQRYLRLLAAVQAPESILALTFTRRAAEEMRSRVVGAIQAAVRAERPPDLNRRTWVLAVAARRHLQTLGIDVERHPSRLRIETIDAFNAWLAAQLPITSGAGGRLNLVENARPLYEDAARRALAHEDLFGQAVEQVLAVGDQRWGELVRLLADMLRTRDRWLPLLVGRLHAASALDEDQLARIRRHFDEDLELLVTRALKSAHEALGGEAIAALSPLLRAAAQRLAGQRLELTPWESDGSALQAHPSDLARWRAIAALCLTNQGKLRKQVNRTDGFPPGCLEKGPITDLLGQFEKQDEILQALRTVRGLPDPKYGDEDWARARNVAQVLVLAAAELDAVFREQGVADFPAVSIAALRALGTAESPSDLALRLDYRLQHLLLDEFQDTSTAQLELVRMLTAGWQRGDGRSVFCVGDPMQSIYGFRQAEVRAFLELDEEGIGDVEFDVQRLSSNFRSDRVLIDWINRCFERIMPRNDDRERGAIAFRPSDGALSRAAGSDPQVSLRGFAASTDEARAVAQLIEERRRQHPDWKIAVLVRARVHAREIAHCLRARGIAFRAVEIEPLQDRPAVRDLVMLICALTHLGNRTAWLAVLRAPWCGLTLADLLVIARAGPVIWDALCEGAVLELLSEDGRARCERLRSVLESAFRVHGHTPTARWVERAWLGLGGAGCAADARELEHVRAVFARLRQLEERGLPDAADLAAAFADLYADGGLESAVEIMTIHKSKGLEFDCVIVPALDRRSRAAPGQLLLMLPFARTERDGMVMAARPPVGAGTDRLFEFLRRQAREAAGLEAERLLYVACTRAKYQLHLSATIGWREDLDEPAAEDADEATDAPAKADTPLPWKPFAGSLLAVLWPVVGREFEIAPPGEAPAPQAALRGGPLRRVPRDWSPHAPQPLGGMTPGAAGLREETPAFDWAGETARRVGSLVHAELQVMDLAHADETAIRARAAHFKRWLALHGVPSERLRDASERVIAALIGVHRDPRGRWILRSGYRDDFREHALSGYWRGEVLRAVFDRSFIDEQGTRWVIDYKTSQHTGGGLEEFLEREVGRYRPQLERYARLAKKLGPEPVRVGLYFPLMRAWREWVPAS
jgi:ATP-dependent helicase/nuclease subunit A